MSQNGTAESPRSGIALVAAEVEAREARAAAREAGK